MSKSTKRSDFDNERVTVELSRLGPLNDVRRIDLLITGPRRDVLLAAGKIFANATVLVREVPNG